MKKTKKFMPSGMLMLICMAAGTYYLVSCVTPWIIEKRSEKQQYQSNPGQAPTGGGAGNGGKLNLI